MFAITVPEDDDAFDYLHPSVRTDTNREAAELEDWFRTVAIARYNTYDADPTDVFTTDEVRKAVVERLTPLAKAKKFLKNIYDSLLTAPSTTHLLKK